MGEERARDRAVERDDWGQLYLYDLETGKLKNPITTGEGNVTQVLGVDEKTRTIWFLGVPEDATHDVSLSPSGK